jgi:hypothetical protein
MPKKGLSKRAADLEELRLVAKYKWEFFRRSPDFSNKQLEYELALSEGQYVPDEASSFLGYTGPGLPWDDHWGGRERVNSKNPAQRFLAEI